MKVPRAVSLVALSLAFAASAYALTFDQWRGAHFTAAELADPAVSGMEANPAGDGLSNLLKYAFDLDPHAAAIAGAPVVSRSAGRMALSYFHRTDAADLFYQLEVSPDLYRWSIRNTHVPTVVLPLGVVEQWTVPDTGPFPAQAPNHFLRLRVWQGNGQVELWDGPQALAATAGRPLIAAELLWADRSNLETGYELQRRQPPDTDWQPLAVTPADTLSYHDAAVVGSATYAYRVRARFSQNLVSPWSAEAAATMLLDSDGDGLADVTETALGLNPLLFSTGGSGLPDGWLWAHFLALFDPAIGDLDSDGDGLTNAQEHAADTDPNDTDSDHDGTPDGSDGHPTDPKRSADIPVRYYGVIDLSAGLDNPFVMDNWPNPLEWVASASGDTMTLNDAGRVAFAGIGTTETGQTALRSVVWQNGEVLTDRTTTYGNDPANPSVHHDIVPAGVNIDGDVFGNVGLTTYSTTDSDSNAGIFSFTSGNYYETTTLTDSNAWFSATLLVSPSGTIFGLEGGYDETYGQHATPFFGAKRFTDYIYYDVWPHAASASDKLVWTAYQPYGDPAGETFIWDPATQTNEPVALGDAHPLAINDQKQIVGDLWQDDPERGRLGFFYAGGQFQTFHDLLPEKFRKQIRSAIPFLIGNADPATQHVIVTFSAEALEGKDKLSWVAGTFRWSRLPTDSEAVIEKIGIPADSEVQFEAGTTKGGYAVKVTKKDAAGATPAPARPGKAIALRFTPRDAEKVNWGFDPPMEGDGPLEKDFDKTPREWWTSVTRTGEYNVNEHLYLEFDSQGDADGCDFYVPTESNAFITFSHTRVGGEGAGLAVKNELKITGKDSSTQPIKATAEVWVVPKGSALVDGKLNHEALAKLMVRLLPQRQIKVGIYRVSDSTSTDTAIPLPGEGANDMPSDTKIIGVLKRIYRQACISISQDTAHSGTLNVPYDTATNRDGRLDYRVTPASAEENSLFTQGGFGAKINLVILGKTADPSRPQGYRRKDVATNTALIFVENFTDAKHGLLLSDLPYTCAHEFGHILNLSSRTASPDGVPFVPPNDRQQHDN